MYYHIEILSLVETHQSIDSSKGLKLFTIGFTKKSAKEFFRLLIQNGVKRIIDVRLNNKSQLAGFTKSEDLQYFLKTIGDIEYIHKPNYAPTKELLDAYKNKKIDWDEYELKYFNILKDRNILKNIDYSIFNNACLLCSEATPEQCHRRLFSEYLKKQNKLINLIHL